MSDKNISEEDSLFKDYLSNQDASCFEKLFKMTKPWLSKLIYRIVLNQSATNDILQETWIKLLKSNGYLNPKRNITNYLYTIAKNESLKYIRENNQHNSKTKANNEELDYEDPECIQINNEKVATIRNAIEKLNKDYQNVVYLHYYAEMEISEIAVILNKPEGTIKTWLSRARKSLEIKLLTYFKN
jgi:RNA polymerase sigma-70 factor (ECF subfamily)